jgi:hypothetical protein
LRQKGVFMNHAIGDTRVERERMLLHASQLKNAKTTAE